MATRWFQLDALAPNGRGFLARLWTFLAYMGRLALYTWKQLVKDQCLTSASALAFATLGAIVPVATIAFSIFKPFQKLADYEQNIKSQVFYWLLAVYGASQEEQSLNDIATRYANDINNWITYLSNQLNLYTLNAVSLGALIVVAVFLLNTVEGAFNDIWHVQQKRRFLYKFVVFWAVVSLGPVLIGASIYLSSYVLSRADPYLASWRGLGLISKSFFVCLPLLISILVFFLAYYLLPNAKVRWRPALAGAVVAAVLWHLAKRGMYLYVVNVVPYSQIYGSIGLIMIFMLWLFLTWVIVLFGVEVSYTSQNLHALRYLDQRRKVHFTPLSERLTLRIVLLAAKALLEGRGPLTVGDIAQQLGVAEDEIRPIADRLAVTRLFTVVNPAGGPFGHDMQFVLAKAPETLTVRETLQSVREDEDWALSTCRGEELQHLSGLFRQLDSCADPILKDLTLASLLKRLQTE